MSLICIFIQPVYGFEISSVAKLIRYISEDRKFQIKVKEEFIIGHFNKLIDGEELLLQPCGL